MAALTCAVTVMTACSGGDDDADDATGGSTGNVAVFCEQFIDEGLRFRSQFEDPTGTGDLLQDLAEVVAAPNDLASLFGGLIDSAPAEIADDHQAAVRDAFQDQADALGSSRVRSRGDLRGVGDCVAR